MRYLWIILVSALFFPREGHAQAEKETIEYRVKALWNAKSIRIEMGKGYSTRAETGASFFIPTPELTDWGKDNTMTFDSIDFEKGTARLIARFAGDVLAFRTVGGVWFLETTESGSVHITYIFANKGIRDYPCVMSRHTIFGIGSLVSQTFGIARIIDPM